MATAEEMNSLRRVVRQYKVVDDQVADMNKQLARLREQRKLVEVELGDILRLPAFATYEKLDNTDDGSIIKIKRPGTHTSGWSLSKRDLDTHLAAYFGTHGPFTSNDCYNFIVDAVRRTSVNNTLSIERLRRE